MILSDAHLKQLIIDNNIHIVNPINLEDIQPNSIDLHLGDELKTVRGKSIDIGQDSYKLKPMEFLL